MQGDRLLARCGEVTEDVLRTVFAQSVRHRVLLEGIALKLTAVLAGLGNAPQSTVNEVAAASVACLRRVPGAVPTIAFLSGGKSSQSASERLNAINAEFSRHRLGRFRSPLRARCKPGFGDRARDNAHGAAAQAALNRRAKLSRAPAVESTAAQWSPRERKACQRRPVLSPVMCCKRRSA